MGMTSGLSGPSGGGSFTGGGMGSAGARKIAGYFILVLSATVNVNPPDVLHSSHSEAAVAGAARAAGENPCTGHCVTADRARQSERVATGRSRQNAHSELARDAAVEIAGKRKCAAFGFVGDEAV